MTTSKEDVFTGLVEGVKKAWKTKKMLAWQYHGVDWYVRGRSDMAVSLVK